MKKLYSLAVVFCLALMGFVFSSCENQSTSSYLFGYELSDSNTVDESTLMQFELSQDGAIVIYNEMKKTADQSSDASRTCIWKDTRENAIKSAKSAFAAGMEAVRKDAASFKGIIISLYYHDPDTNKKVEVEKATI
jgi:hypothetical protein